MAGELPSGTVTFLFSDIEGSTRLLQQLRDRWGEVVAAHNRIMRQAFEASGGREVDRQGDAFFAVFARARNAVAAAVTAQQGLANHEWPEDIELRVRMGIHTGEPAVGDEGYLGLDVVRAARICSLASGGQVLVSETTRALVRGDLDELELADVGEHELKGIEGRERLFQLVGAGLTTAQPAPVSPPTPPELDVAGRQIELANSALARLRELELGPLASLGPTIERQVQEALGRAQPAEQARMAEEITRGLGELERLPASPGRMIVGGVAIALVVVLGLVALLVWLVTSLV